MSAQYFHGFWTLYFSQVASRYAYWVRVAASLRVNWKNQAQSSQETNLVNLLAIKVNYAKESFTWYDSIRHLQNTLCQIVVTK